jgi:cell division protein FtsL
VCRPAPDETPHIEEALRSTIKMKLLATVLVVLFFVGLVGSAIVVVVTFIEDIKLFFERDEKPVGTAKRDGLEK